MSLKLDQEVAPVGTRFLIFPEPRFLGIFDRPEEVVISVPPDQIQDGPADDRMFVVDALGKQPYNPFFRPPWNGNTGDKVEKGTDGHFTHLDPNSRAFSAATMYATVRRVLDIWEDYFDHRIAWHFESSFARLELIPLIDWDNAQSGYGFLEFGYGRKPDGTIDHSRPYCENFDVLAHELGHSIVFSEVGVPASELTATVDYGGMHESAGDLVAIIGSLHFDSVVNLLLERTRGNLLTINGLSRVGELSESREIRIALNNRRMTDVGNQPHERSLPLTGAIFDTMVEVFQKDLVAKQLITEELRRDSTNSLGGPQGLADIATRFNAAYTGHEAAFKEALLLARDYLGRLLAVTWGNLNPDFITYHDVLRGLMRADREITNGANLDIIRECFAWRAIGPVPTSILLQPHTLQMCGLHD